MQIAIVAFDAETQRKMTCAIWPEHSQLMYQGLPLFLSLLYPQLC